MIKMRVSYTPENREVRLECSTEDTECCCLYSVPDGANKIHS